MPLQAMTEHRQKLATSATEPDTSELVELLQQSAVEHLTICHHYRFSLISFTRRKRGLASRCAFVFSSEVALSTEDKDEARGTNAWFCIHGCHNRFWGVVRVQTWTQQRGHIGKFRGLSIGTIKFDLGWPWGVKIMVIFLTWNMSRMARITMSGPMEII